MNLKTWAPLVIALGLGLIAAVLARNTLLQHRAADVQARTTVSVVVARGPIPPGQELTTEMLTMSAIAAKTPPPESFLSPAQLVGRVTIAPIVAGQTIQQSLLAPKGTASGLQALVPPGMRAITLDVNESSGLAGLLLPGAHVDVVTTATNTAKPERSVSRAIVRNAPVVAVGQRLSGPKPDGEKESAVSRTVTLVVTPRQAEALDLALTAARLRLVLRAQGDNTETQDDGVMLAELTGQQEMETEPIATPTIHGSQNPGPTSQPGHTEQPTQIAPPVFSHVDDSPRRRVVTVIAGDQEHQLTFREEREAGGVANTPNDRAIP